MKKHETLIDLIKENPELNVVPMVDHEVVAGDDFAYWLASWGKASIDEYCVNDERVYIKSKDDMQFEIDNICDVLRDDHPSYSEEKIERIAKAEVANWPWRRAIIVWIEV